MALRINKAITEALDAARHGETVDLGSLVIPRMAPAGSIIGKAPGTESDLVRRFRLSDASVDRDNDTINPRGWLLEDFDRNGAVLWAHSNWDPPVATPGETFVDAPKDSDVGASLIGDAKFVEDYEFSMLLLRLINAGALKNVSVGFAPVEWVYNESRGGIDFAAQKLIEWSVVPIGSNVNAMIQVGKSADITPFLAWGQKWLDRDKDVAAALGDEDEMAAICKALAPYAATVDPGMAPSDESTEAKAPTETATVEKAGRVLSRKNQDRLESIKALVDEILESAAPDEDVEDDVEDEEEGKAVVELSTKTLDALIEQADSEDVAAALESAKSALNAPPLEITPALISEIVGRAVDAQIGTTKMVSLDDARDMVERAVEEASEEFLRRTGRLPA